MSSQNNRNTDKIIIFRYNHDAYVLQIVNTLSELIVIPKISDLRLN